MKRQIKKTLFLSGYLVLLSFLVISIAYPSGEEPLQIRVNEEPLEMEADEERGINNGFVFWEGRYLEAPYRVESHDLAVFINGIQVTKKLEWPPRDLRVDEDPGMPVDVTSEAGLAALDTIRGANGDPHMGLKVRYLYQHFPREEAREKIVEYLKALSYIKSVTVIQKDILELEDYYGENRLVDISYIEIGPPPIREEYESAVERAKNDIILDLKKGYCTFFFRNGEISFSRLRAARVLPEAVTVLRDASLDIDTVKAILEELGIVRSTDILGEILIHNFEASRQIDSRLEKLREQIIKEHGPEALEQFQEGSSSKNKDTPEGDRDIAYSPDGTCYYAYYVNAWQRPYMTEINSIKNNIIDQGYDCCIWTDATDDDNDPGFCTLENWKDCEFAAVLSIHSHGNEGWFAAIYLKDESAVDDWRGTENNISTVQSTAVTWGTPPNTYHPYFALVRKGWASDNWESDLTEAKAIVFVNSCHGNDKSGDPPTSFLTLCGGGVGFGYPGDCDWSDRTDNNNELLERMNGTEDDGEHRKAGEAYTNMPSHKDNMEMEGSSDITLCPATEEFYPQDGALVGNSGTGYFQVDTYCHDDVAADEALTFTTTGAVTISNVHWVGNDEVNRIEFDWNGIGSFNVVVTVHADKFHSWGAADIYYHELDGDRVTPNGDNKVWVFFTAGPRCMDFENGVDGEAIQSKIPGMFFSTTQGYDWIYGDKTTGNYNVWPYGSGAYVCNSNFFAWLGVNQGMGRIDFTGETARTVSMWTSCYYPVLLEAYDADGDLLASDQVPGNLWTHTLSHLSVTASNIAYVLVHDQGNYWLIDDLCVDDLLAQAEAYLPEGSEPGMEVLETIEQGQSETHSFDNLIGRILDIILHWFGSEMNLRIYKPDGTLYGEWQTNNPPIIVTIPQAEAGTWLFEVTATDVPHDDYPYALIVAAPLTGTHDVYSAASDVMFSHEYPSPGDLVSIFDVVRCDAISESIDSVKVRFYDGDPAQGAQINGDQTAYSIVPGGCDTVQVNWVFPDPVPHEIHVFIDPDDELWEYDEENNRAANIYVPTAPVVIDMTNGPDWPAVSHPVFCYIELPREYDPKDIRIRTIFLSGVNGSIPPRNFPGIPWEIGDYDEDGILDLMVTFDNAEITGIVEPDSLVVTLTGKVDYRGSERCPPVKEVPFEGVYPLVRGGGKPLAYPLNITPIPNVTFLGGNRPNPFSSGTSISYGIAEFSSVTLRIYDAAGRVVATVVNANLEPGYCTAYWDGKDQSGRRVGAGIYFYRLTVGEYTGVNKMILVR